MARIWMLAVGLSGCASSGLEDQRAAPRPDGAEADRERGNWVDEDTNGVGTHRIMGDHVNIRGDDLDRVLAIAGQGDQLVITAARREYRGHTYVEAVFRGGELEGQHGWVASQFLAHTELRVCGDGVAIRTGNTLGDVVGRASRGETATVVSGTIRNTGAYRYFEVSVDGVRGFLATDFLCGEGGGGGSTAGLATTLREHHFDGTFYLWPENFGRNDGASPFENVDDAAAGLPSRQSCHGSAPCGEVFLDPALLDGMRALVEVYGFDYFVTSIAGASHSPGSYHYDGRAVDVGEVDGVLIYGDSAQARAFMNACWDLGAIEVFGPSNDPAGHYDHLHCAW